MAEIRSRDHVEFEPVVRRTDVQLTKPFSVGDEMVRALFTSTGRAVLTPVSGDDLISTVVVVSDEDDVVELSFGEIWQAAKAIATAIVDVVTGGGGGGGGGDCKGNVNITVNVTGGGSVGSVNVNANNCQQQ